MTTDQLLIILVILGTLKLITDIMTSWHIFKRDRELLEYRKAGDEQSRNVLMMEIAERMSLMRQLSKALGKDER